MQALRPWSTESSERRWAMGIAVVCFIILITLPFWSEKKHASEEIKHPDTALASKQTTAVNIQKHSPTKIISKPAESHSKQAIKETINPVKNHTTPIQNTQKNTTLISSQAYFIQVGAFQDKSHAQKLQKQLIKKHWSVIILKKKHLYAVQIGPYKNKEKANRIKKQLSDKEKVNGFVTHHAYP